MNYLLFVLMWIIYLGLHSFLAADRVKASIKQHMGSAFRYYRIIYSIVATLLLMALLVFNAALPSVLLFDNKGLSHYVSLMLTTLGVIIISRSFREYSFGSFIGLRTETHELKRTGILKIVRHPIYSGTILIVIGFFMFYPTIGTLISVSCILAYLPIGIYFEEKKLIREFGEKYLNYKKEVPSVIPRFKKKLF